MGKHKVYISSTYRDLADYRQRVIDFFRIKRIQESFDVVSMEGYVADDIEPSQECVNDVANNCTIYILIIAKRYGFIPRDDVKNPRGLSITEMEYEMAVNTRKTIFAFLCDEATAFEGDNDPDPVVQTEKLQKLKAFKQLVQNQKLTHVHGFKNPDNLAIQVAESVYSKFFPAIEAERRENLDKIYFCDRQAQSVSFSMYFQNEKAIQFVLINSHEKDMPHFFVKRKNIEFIESDIRTIDLFVYPTIVEDTDFDFLEFSMKAAIKEEWNRNEVLRNYKLKNPNDFNVEKALAVMTELKYDYLLIAWEIQSIYWKNDNLKSYISKFYEKYDEINATLNTDKKIFFIGLVSYTDDPDMPFAEFEEKVRTIIYGKKPIKLSRIKKQEIKDWMKDYDIEDNPDTQEALIKEVLPVAAGADFYFSELESPLRTILERAYLQS